MSDLFFCEKCGYSGQTSEHAGCSYLAWDVDYKDKLIAALQVENEKLRVKALRLEGIRELCGYVEDGSSQSVHITQDDATNEWILHIGPVLSTNWFHSRSFEGVIDKAMKGTR